MVPLFNTNSLLFKIGKFNLILLSQGLYTESTSDGFYVDTSPPEVSLPILNRTGSLVPNSIVYRTSLGIHWTAADKESFIERQYLSLQSHIGGDFNMSSIQVIKYMSLYGSH